MYTANPFIIFGNPGTLAKLKKYGYKTFDKFWDESYDEDVDLSIRLSRLIKTMETIASTPWDIINSWMEEIEEILEVAEALVEEEIVAAEPVAQPVVEEPVAEAPAQENNDWVEDADGNFVKKDQE